jgi:hypothetical protein
VLAAVALLATWAGHRAGAGHGRAPLTGGRIAEAARR